MTKGVAITTARFVLRELTVGDVSARYLSWFSDAATAKYIVAAGHTKELQDLKDYVQERTGRDNVLFFGIFDAATGAHIGNVKYEPVDSDLGYTIMGILIGDPAWRGKGVAREVLAACGAWLRDHRQIRQIVLRVSKDNPRAIRAYRVAGFTVEDTPYIPSGSHPEYITMVWHL